MGEVYSRDKVSNNPASPDSDVVAGIWQRVFGVSAHHGDTLLDLLGNSEGLESPRKLGLFVSEIAAATGVHLPLNIAFRSPTAADVANLLQTGDWRHYDRPACMSSGIAAPVFVLPGIGGIGLDALTLVRHLTLSGPVYFSPPKGVDGSEPHHTLQEVVADHIAGIKAIQPQGPYWLLGYSWGGLVALEIARTLRAEGEEIAFLAMIDPVLNAVDWTYSAWLQFVGTRIQLHLKALRQAATPYEAFRYGQRLIIPIVDKVVRLFGFNQLWPLEQNADVLPPALAAIWSAESEMIKLYRVKYYNGPMTLFATRSGHAAECNPEKVWPHKVSQLDLQWIPGDHAMSAATVQATADSISAVIEAHRLKEAPDHVAAGRGTA